MDSSEHHTRNHMQRLLLVFLSATALTARKTPMHYTFVPMPPIARTNQVDTNEVMAMIELCVDLDNQDDRMNPQHGIRRGVSQDYAWAGDVIPLPGLYNGGEYYHNPARDQNDAWVQHHATSYRRLFETTFDYPATVEQPQPRP